MKVGSLVECVNDNFPIDRIYNEVKPLKGKIYTIREIVETSFCVTVNLEELVNPIIEYLDGTDETSFDIRGFRELLPPMQIDIEQICERELVS
jgi:hypothetical protein